MGHVSNPCVVGADPGISGAWCVFDLKLKKPVQVCKNPFIHFKDRYAKPVADYHKFNEQILPFLPKMVLIETSQIRMTTNSRKTVAGIWWYAGILDTIFRLHHFNIDYVDPKEWQESILLSSLGTLGATRPDKEHGDLHSQWKELSKLYVRSKYGSKIMVPENGTVENDGFADSICIAEYAASLVNSGKGVKRVWKHNPTKAAKTRKKVNK